jgi:hypothetical protein
LKSQNTVSPNNNATLLCTKLHLLVTRWNKAVVRNQAVFASREAVFHIAAAAAFDGLSSIPHHHNKSNQTLCTIISIPSQAPR